MKLKDKLMKMFNKEIDFKEESIDILNKTNFRDHFQYSLYDHNIYNIEIRTYLTNDTYRYLIYDINTTENRFNTVGYPYNQAVEMINTLIDTKKKYTKKNRMGKRKRTINEN